MLRRGVWQRSFYGFTLIEIMVVIIILGVIASFALTRFNQTLEYERARTMRRNLIEIYSAYLIKQVRPDGVASPPAGETWILSDINSNLKLDIPADPNVNYIWVGGIAEVVAERIP